MQMDHGRNKIFLCCLRLLLAISTLTSVVVSKADSSRSIGPLDLTSQDQNLFPIEGWDQGFNQVIHQISIQPEQWLSKYDHLDPEQKISDKALKLALVFFEAHQSRIQNKNFITLIDYSKPSNAERMFIINMQSGEVQSLLVSHGRGSDPDHDGRAQFFSNTPESHMTSLGFYLTANEYQGKHGRSMKLVGLSQSNSLALDRAIVIHGANYVSEGRAQIGRSHGCPAVDFKYLNPVIDNLKGGSLIFAWAGADELN